MNGEPRADAGSSTNAATTAVRRSILLAAVVLAAAFAATAALAAAPNTAKLLVLLKSDFPSGAVAKDGSGSATAAGSGYGVTYLYRTAGKPNELSASVAVFKSRSLAVQMFKEYRGEMSSAAPKLKLPRYGEEQVADFSVLGGSRLIVRTGSVVWVLELQTFLTRSGQTHELTKAEAIAEYARYAPKQQSRVREGSR